MFNILCPWISSISLIKFICLSCVVTLVSSNSYEREAQIRQIISKLRVVGMREPNINIANLIDCIQDPTISQPMLNYISASADNTLEDQGKSDSALLKEYFFEQLNKATHITKMDYLKIIDDIESLSDLKYLSRLLKIGQRYNTKPARALLLFIDWSSNLSKIKFSSNMCTNLKILEKKFDESHLRLIVRTEIETKVPDVIHYLKNGYRINYPEETVRRKVNEMLSIVYMIVKQYSPNDQNLPEIASMLDATYSKIVRLPMLMLMGKILLREYFIEYDEGADVLNLEYFKQKTQFNPSLSMDDESYLQFNKWSFEQKLYKFQELANLNIRNPLFFTLNWYFLTQHLMETKIVENSWIAREKSFQDALEQYRYDGIIPNVLPVRRNGPHMTKNSKESGEQMKNLMATVENSRRIINQMISTNSEDKIKKDNNIKLYKEQSNIADIEMNPRRSYIADNEIYHHRGDGADSEMQPHRRANSLTKKSDKELVNDAQQHLEKIAVAVNLSNGNKTMLNILRNINETLHSKEITREMLIFLNELLQKQLETEDFLFNTPIFNRILIEYITERINKQPNLQKFSEMEKTDFCKMLSNQKFDSDMIALLFLDVRWFINKLLEYNSEVNVFSMIDGYFDNIFDNFNSAFN